MADKNRIVELLLSIVDQLNQQLMPEDQLEASAQAILTGEGAQLDSLGIINFIIAVEQRIEAEYQRTITLTGDNVLAAPDGPLRTVDSLADFLITQLKGQLDV